MPSLYDVPGFAEEYAAALEKERADRRLREEAWFVSSHSWTICGERVRAMRVSDLQVLAILGNVIVEGGEASAGDYAAIIWHLRAKRSRLWDRWRHARFVRRLSTLPAQQVIQEVTDYIEWSCGIMPSTAQDGAAQWSPESLGAMYVDLLASEYGWRIDYILQLPLVQVSQLVERIRRRHQPQSWPEHPAVEVRRRALERLNAMMHANN